MMEVTEVGWVELRVIEQLKYETVKKLVEDGPDPRKKERAALKMGCTVRTKEDDYPVKKREWRVSVMETQDRIRQMR